MIKPTGSKVLVELRLPKKTTDSGIELMQEVKAEIVQAKVLELGRDVKEVELGAEVWLSPYAIGDEIKPQDGDQMMVEEEDILMQRPHESK